MVEKDIKKIVLHEVPGIARCFLGDEQGPSGTEFHLKTEGINMHVSYLVSLVNIRMQGWHRLEKYLNLEGFLEKSLKIKSVLKSTRKHSKALKSP